MIETAVILAGGLGTRLQSVVNDVPKPLARVNDRPFLSYQLRYLKYYGLKHFILSVGHLSEKVTACYGNSFEGVPVTYAIETEPLGTGGGIRNALHFSVHDEALVLNGDSFFDLDLNRFAALHLQSNSACSLALRKVEDASRYGTIKLDPQNRISAFAEKTALQRPGLINGGVYILNKNIFTSNSPATGAFSIEKDFFQKCAPSLVMKGFEFNDYFIDIGIPADYEKAQDDFKRFKY
jgi:D-glycero-alpha-D-manno-heptose 1-phosphate guanylyltransferase